MLAAAGTHWELTIDSFTGMGGGSNGNICNWTFLSVNSFGTVFGFVGVGSGFLEIFIVRPLTFTKNVEGT